MNQKPLYLIILLTFFLRSNAGTQQPKTDNLLFSKTLPEHYSPNAPQGWSRDGIFFAFAYQNSVTVYDTKKNNIATWIIEQKLSNKKHTSKKLASLVTALTFVPQNKALLAVDSNGTLTHFTLSPEYEQTYQQKHAVSSFTKQIIISPDTNYIATLEQSPNALKKQQLKIFSCKKENKKFCINYYAEIPQKGALIKAAFSPNEEQFITCFSDGRIILFSLQTKKALSLSNAILNDTKHRHTMIDITNDNKILWALPTENTSEWEIAYFQNEKLHNVGTTTGHSITTYAYHNQTSSIAASNENGTIFLFRGENKKAKTFHRPPNKKHGKESQQFTQLWFSTDGKLLFGIAEDHLLCCWNTKTGTCFILSKHIHPEQSIIFDDNNIPCLATCNEKNLFILQLKNEHNKEQKNCSIM